MNFYVAKSIALESCGSIVNRKTNKILYFLPQGFQYTYSSSLQQRVRRPPESVPSTSTNISHNNSLRSSECLSMSHPPPTTDENIKPGIKHGYGQCEEVQQYPAHKMPKSKSFSQVKTTNTCFPSKHNALRWCWWSLSQLEVFY